MKIGDEIVIGHETVHPQDVATFTIDWALPPPRQMRGFLEAGVTIVSAGWMIPAPLSSFDSSIIDDNKTAVVGVRGFVDGRDYYLDCHVTLSDGQEFTRRLIVYARSVVSETD